MKNDPIPGLTQPIHSTLHKINYRLKEKPQVKKAELKTTAYKYMK